MENILREKSVFTEPILETVKTLSKKLQIPAYTIRYWCRENHIPYIKLNRKYYFELDVVLNFLKDNYYQSN